MHVHLPKPLHGWRAFVGEVGIIVVGVLIALGAEQAVEALHWRSEVSHFRADVDHELGRNLGLYRQVISQRPCVTKRLADLERFIAHSRAGHEDRLARPIGRPNYYSQYFSVWDNRGAEVTEHLPRDTRVRYGELYDEFHNNEAVRSNERDVWRSLGQFDEPGPLDLDHRMRLRELLDRGEALNEVTSGNYDYILKLARPLGILPISDPNLVHLAAEPSFCQPLLANQ
jgi:hypothetical protein